MNVSEKNDYEESSRKDRQETVREISLPGNTNKLRELASDARINGEAQDVVEVIGQVVQVCAGSRFLNLTFS